MKIAKESLINLLKHLNNEDRFGLVVFNSNAFIIQKLMKLKDINMLQLKQKIMGISAGGGTCLEKGYSESTKLWNVNNDMIDGKSMLLDDIEYMNRIIYLTDAIPNINNDVSDKNLFKLVNENAMELEIYSTFIGIGLDFGTTLIEMITKTKGANYFSVASKEAFFKRMDEEFEFSVSPLVFNLCLKLKSEGNQTIISNVYGAPNTNKDELLKGNVMKIDTLFPSQSNDENQVKGGIVLLKLENRNKESDCINMEVEVSYEDINGKLHKNKQLIVFGNGNVNVKQEYFGHSGIRKAILLQRYVDVLKEWIKIENIKGESFQALNVGNDSKLKFENFKLYFEKEMKEIGDDLLQKEVDLLNKLINFDCNKDKPNMVFNNNILDLNANQEIANNSGWCCGY
eukprot:174204_1